MHQLICGCTESGKTTLGKLIAKGLKNAGKNVIVLDPLKDTEWECNFITHDGDEFLSHIYNPANIGAYLFIDEGSHSVGKYNKPIDWLFTTGRHVGYSCTIISQRTQQISLNVTSQCTRLFLFACIQRDADLFADEYRAEELRACGQMGKFEFFIVSRFDTVRKGRIDVVNKVVTYEPFHNVKRKGKVKRNGVEGKQ